jgi:nucleotide sugar dehydrogenase
LLLGQSKENILRLIDAGELKVSIYGLGRVGLPLAVAWLRAGQRVIGADINRETVAKINKGISPFLDEPNIPQAVRSFVREGRFNATTDLVKASENSDVKFVTVPTTTISKKGFNGEALELALRSMGRGLKKGDAVSIECTVPPTTTEKWVKPILEEESLLVAGEEFALAFSPERVYEGRVLEDIEERYTKIVGGIDHKSTELFSILYGRIAKKGVLEMSSSTVAELSKVFEGIYRDVNIALANELSKFCHKLDISFEEVRMASNSQPFSHIHKPGPGVGGACIPFYPYFVLERADNIGVKMGLTMLARNINEGMPDYVLLLAQKAMDEIGKELPDKKTAVLGLAFRGDVADSRSSPTYEIVDRLVEMRAEVIVHDPFIEYDKRLASKCVRLVKSIEDAVGDASLLIIATDHTEYKKIDLTKIVRMMDSPAAVVDGRNVIKITQIPKGMYFTGIGMKTINTLSK